MAGFDSYTPDDSDDDLSPSDRQALVRALLKATPEFLPRIANQPPEPALWQPSPRDYARGLMATLPDDESRRLRQTLFGADPSPAPPAFVPLLGLGQPAVPQQISGNSFLPDDSPADARPDAGQPATDVRVDPYVTRAAGALYAENNEYNSQPQGNDGFPATGLAGRRFRTRDEAEYAAAKHIRNKARFEKPYEYSTTIFQNDDGSYSYTPPASIDSQISSIPGPAPFDTGYVSDVHNHVAVPWLGGWLYDRFGNPHWHTRAEQGRFSNVDEDQADRYQNRILLVTPDGYLIPRDPKPRSSRP